MYKEYRNSIYIDADVKNDIVGIEFGLSKFKGSNPDFWIDMDVLKKDRDYIIIQSRLQTWESCFDLPNTIIKTEEEKFQYSLLLPSTMDGYEVQSDFIFMIHELCFDIAYDTFNGVKYDEVIKSYRTIDITHTNNVVLEYRIE